MSLRNQHSVSYNLHPDYYFDVLLSSDCNLEILGMLFFFSFFFFFLLGMLLHSVHVVYRESLVIADCINKCGFRKLD